jgi:hypothetical protein
MTDIYSKRVYGKPSKRQQAHAMFLDGKDMEYVIKELQLKRNTASVYLFEARCILAKAQSDKLLD